MSESLDEIQQRICSTYGAAYEPPAAGSKVGLAIKTLELVPIHGIRVPPTEMTCGWYIHGGDAYSDDPDFYQPLCVEHLADYCGLAMPFMCLPPGWRFMTDGRGFIDVWQDA